MNSRFKLEYEKIDEIYYGTIRQFSIHVQSPSKEEMIEDAKTSVKVFFHHLADKIGNSTEIPFEVIGVDFDEINGVKDPTNKKDFIERYKKIVDSDWFKAAYKDRLTDI